MDLGVDFSSALHCPSPGEMLSTMAKGKLAQPTAGWNYFRY